MRTIDDEPVECLWTGAIVLHAIVSHMRWLQSRGHTITVDRDTRVRVAPTVPHDTWYVLDSCWRDVVAVLEAQEFTGFTPTHPLGTSRMVH